MQLCKKQPKKFIEGVHACIRERVEFHLRSHIFNWSEVGKTQWFQYVVRRLPEFWQAGNGAELVGAPLVFGSSLRN
jgi:hypothetical protein